MAGAAHRLSASGVHLAVHCAHSFRCDVTLPPDKPGRAATKGTAFHSTVEDYLSDGVYPATEDPSFTLFSVWLDWWERSPVSRDPKVMAELPLILDVEAGTVRLGPAAEHRDYGDVSLSEVPMTLDLAADSGDRAVIFDWKSGRPADPCESQLSTNAVAWARYLGHRQARAQAIYVTDAGVIEAEPIRMDALDLDAHLVTLRRIMRRLPLAGPVAGSWCAAHYCKIRTTCKPHRSYLKETRP